MLKKSTVVVIAALFFHAGFAQEGKPDFKQIEKEVGDKNSPFFYTALMKRYSNNDTLLTNDEYRHLYYGYSFQDSYSAYGKPSVNEDLKKAIKNKETDKIIELEKKALHEFPFNLRNLYRLVNILEDKGDTMQALLYNKKLVGVAKAIMSTGDGATDSTAMYVISVEHEYDLIFLLGYEFDGSQALVQVKDGPTDKMKLKKNDDNLEYMYFNVTTLFKSMSKMFEKK